MQPSRVRQRWAQGKPVFCTQVKLTDPTCSELIAMQGYDCIWVDLEHHPHHLETLVALTRGAQRYGADILARPAKWEYMRMGRMLEAGAHGILYPRCDDATEAAEVIRWAKFAPMGERGVDTSNPDNPFGTTPAAEYVRMANAETFIAVQIESPAAVPHARAMAEVEGVDIVFFGPGDYSVLTGLPGQTTHASVLEARATVCRETLAGGARFGTLCFSLEDVKRVLGMGATFIAYMSDLGLIRSGFDALRQDLEAMGFDFGTPA